MLVLPLALGRTATICTVSINQKFYCVNNKGKSYFPHYRVRVIDLRIRLINTSTGGCRLLWQPPLAALPPPLPASGRLHQGPQRNAPCPSLRLLWPQGALPSHLRHILSLCP